MYSANRYFGALDDTPVLNQMLINQAFNKSDNEESPNFKKKEVEVTEENNVEKKEPAKEEKETIIVTNEENKE